MRKALLLTPCGSRISVSMPIYRDQVERLIDGHIEVVYLKDEGALMCSDTFLRDRKPRNVAGESLVAGARIGGCAVVFERDSDVRRVLSAYSWQRNRSSVRKLDIDWGGEPGSVGTVDVRTCDVCQNEFISTIGSWEKHCYVCRSKGEGDEFVRNARGQLVPPETLTAIEAE